MLEGVQIAAQNLGQDLLRVVDPSSVIRQRPLLTMGLSTIASFFLGKPLLGLALKLVKPSQLLATAALASYVGSLGKRGVGGKSSLPMLMNQMRQVTSFLGRRGF